MRVWLCQTRRRLGRQQNMAKPLKTKAAPLTPETVTEAVKDVKWDDLCWCLRVPPSKRDEITTQYPSSDHRRVVVDWWFSTDAAPSWRRLIQQLDCRDTKSAEKIRRNAEPMLDPTFTLRNVTTAVESVHDWIRLGIYLGVPLARRGTREKMLQCFITAVPNASWQTLAGGLYYRQESVALERVAKYFQPQPEATLTVANLCSVLEDVEEWDSLGYYLDVPAAMLREIKRKFSSDPQRKQAMMEEWRNHHPAPSWMTVATALYRIIVRGEYGKYHKELQFVKQKYLEAVVSTAQTAAVCSQPPPQPSPQPPPASPVSTLEGSLSLVEIAFSDLEFTAKVGGGGYGTVSKGRWISKNKIVAIKTTIVLDEREVKILSSLDHPSIIKYYGTATQNDVHYIVTEFAENGSIYDYIFKEHKHPPLSQILLWATQVAEGMVYLHQQDIIHRDLKSSNVVLTSTLRAKICDLGSARSLQHTARQTTAVGTYAWMAPEMLRREEVSKSCDVYSYGVLVFEMATQQIPFHDVVPIVAAVMTMDGKRPTIPETCDPHLSDLIRHCWQQDAKVRPSFEEILVTLRTDLPSD